MQLDLPESLTQRGLGVTDPILGKVSEMLLDPRNSCRLSRLSPPHTSGVLSTALLAGMQLWRVVTAAGEQEVSCLLGIWDNLVGAV